MDELKKRKIINGAKYFMKIKPSQFHLGDVLKLHRYCQYILDELEPVQLSLDETLKKRI